MTTKNSVNLARRYTPSISPEVNRALASSRYKQLNLLTNFLITACRETDRQIVVNMALELTREMFHFDKGIVYLEERGTGRLSSYAVWGFGARFPLALQHGNLFSNWTISLGKPLLIPHEDEPEINEALAQVQASSMVSAPLFRGKAVIGTIQLFSHVRNFFSKEDAQLLWLMGLRVEGSLSLIEEQESAPRASIVDALTCLFTRNYFESALRNHFGWATRKKASLSLLLADADGFKKFNERFKHIHGDQALKEMGEIIRKCCRLTDIPVRYGGDEFAVILPETDETEALVVARRIASSIQRHPFAGHPGGRKVGLTVTIGTCSYPADQKELPGLVEGAELALAKARKVGPNQVIQFSQVPSVESYLAYYRSRPISFERVTEASRLVFNFDRLLDLIVQLSMDGLGAMRSSLLVRDEATGDLILKVAHGAKFLEDSIETLRIKPGESVAGWVAKKKKALVVSDIKEMLGARARNGRGYFNDSCLVVPLLDKGETLGVLNISNKASREVFSEQDMQGFQPVADTLSRFLAKGIKFEHDQKEFIRIAALSLAQVSEARFGVRGDHSKRVARYTVAIAREMGLSSAVINSLKVSAELHDIGFISLNQEIMKKPAKLNIHELAETRRHAYLGWKLLGAFSPLKTERENILYHHERLDGTGYPYGKVGEEIPLGAKIISVADVFEAMTSKRPHREALSKDEALNEIIRGSGTKFDPGVVKAFTRSLS